MEFLGAIFGLFLLVVVAFIVGLKWSVRRHQALTGVPHPTELPSEVRHQTAGLRRLRDEIERTMKANRNLPELQVVGKEAMEASAQLIAKITQVALQRDNIRRAHRNARISEDEEARLELKSAQAASVEEKASIERTLANYRQAKETLEQADGQLAGFDQQVREAEAALSELHSRMSMMTAMGARGTADDLRDNLSHLQSLSSSIEEVEATMGVRH
ncbi:MAG: hypothetical protein KF857_01550 [Fimbriimonadaceae bacterium]|nr:hypothetical protein [Fimbriimonadaceae bacterium]